MAGATEPLLRAYDPALPVLGPIERRVLGNLLLPANPEYLTTRIIEGKVSPDHVDGLLRGDLLEKGWVKVVADADEMDPAKIVAAAQKDKDTVAVHDDSAEIYSRRLTRPDLQWRLQGDLWQLTGEGLAELAAPTVDSPSLPPGRVQEVVDAEWSRVVHDYEPGKGSLVGHLLPDEFAAWFRDVADECERAWGQRPKAPMAGGASGYSDAYEIQLLDHENQKTSLATGDAITGTWYMALGIAAFTDASTGTTIDGGGVIPTYTGYARKSVAAGDMPAASTPGGTASNTGAITFAACTSGTSTIIACGNCKALTLDLLKKWGDVASTVISTTQTPATFAIGAYTTTVT